MLHASQVLLATSSKCCCIVYTCIFYYGFYEITFFLSCVYLQNGKNNKRRRKSNKSEITGFYMKNIAHLLGFSTGFFSPYFSSHQFYGGRCWKTSICISCCRGRLFTFNKPMELSVFTSPPSISCTGEQSF